jgi:hypothetical protein
MSLQGFLAGLIDNIGPKSKNYILKVDDTKKNLDAFIKFSLVTYLNKSDFFMNSIKMFDNNEKKFCKELYILTQDIYNAAVLKSSALFNSTIYKTKYKSGEPLYIFDVDLIKKNDKDFLKKKKLEFRCRLAAAFFVRLYILLKGIFFSYNVNLNSDLLKEYEEKKDELDSEVKIGGAENDKNPFSFIGNFFGEKEKEKDKEKKLSSQSSEKDLDTAPSEEELAQAPSDEELAPAPSEEKLAQAPSEEELAQAPSDEELAPAPSEEKLAPVPSEEALAPAPSEKELAPTPIEKALAPAPSEKELAPAPIEKALAPAPSEEELAPVPSEEALAPALEDDLQKQYKKNYSLNNIIFIFFESIFNKEDRESDDVKIVVNEKDCELKLDEDTLLRNKEMPTFFTFIKNINESKIFKKICRFNKLCDYKIYDKYMKRNILFNDFREINKFINRSKEKTSDLEDLENKYIKNYEKLVKEFDGKYKELYQLILKLFDDKKPGSGLKLCEFINKYKNYENFKLKENKEDEKDSQDGYNRIYSKIRKNIVKLFKDYTDKRNSLYDDIILKIFLMEDKKTDSKDEELNNKLEIKNIRQNITYEDIFKYSYETKIKILDMYIIFFKFLEDLINSLKPLPEENSDNKYAVLIDINDSKNSDLTSTESVVGEEAPGEQAKEKLITEKNEILDDNDDDTSEEEDDDATSEEEDDDDTSEEEDDDDTSEEDDDDTNEGLKTERKQTLKKGGLKNKSTKKNTTKK